MIASPTASGARIRAEAEGLAPSETRHILGILPEIDLGELRLAEPEALAGRVVDSQQKPVVGAELFLGKDREPAARTSSDGGFQLRALRPGCAELTVHAPGFAEWSEALEVARDVNPTIEIALEPQSTRGLRVVDESGSPVAGAAVALGRAGGARRLPLPGPTAAWTSDRFPGSGGARVLRPKVGI